MQSDDDFGLASRGLKSRKRTGDRARARRADAGERRRGDAGDFVEEESKHMFGERGVARRHIERQRQRKRVGEPREQRGQAGIVGGQPDLLAHFKRR